MSPPRPPDRMPVAPDDLTAPVERLARTATDRVAAALRRRPALPSPPRVPRIEHSTLPFPPEPRVGGRAGAWSTRDASGVEHPVDPDDPDALRRVALRLLDPPPETG